ncbi:MAG TPA: PIG-L family deacetylase [Edaphocola sp.]|nr:PIG-L family deacetylase [Edaphocola sp.]
MIKNFLFITFSFFCLNIQYKAAAQQFRASNSTAIYEQLQQLNKLGTVMYIAAHPDDENTRLIAYLIHHDHINTIYLSLTRGDGGQNIIGDEQGAALGLIRTNEMMQARKIDGGKQLFTRFIDFGFTKSPIETFNFWNKQQVIEDVKNAIQQYQPDVLICRFPTTGEGGHGQHTASAIAALEAFNQLQQSKDANVWKPKRILFNAFKFGSANTIKEGQFELPINQYNPLLGEAYGEIAGRSRSEHKSQGAGTPQSYGINNENFELLGGAPFHKSIYEGIDTSWARIGQKNIGKEIENIIQNFSFNNPQNSIKNLINLKSKITQLSNKHEFWKEKKLAQLDKIILSCAGIQMEVLAKTPTCILGEKLPIEVKAIARYPQVKIKTIKSSEEKILISDISLENDILWAQNSILQVSQTLPITQPYWLQEPSKNNQFAYPKPYTNEPLSKNDFVLAVQIEIDNKDFKINVPVSYKRLDPTRGDVVEAVRIMPDIDLEPLSHKIVIEKGASFQLGVIVNARKDFDNARLEIINEQGKILAKKENLKLKSGEQNRIEISIPGGVINDQSKPNPVYYRILSNGLKYNKQLHVINYSHIPTLQYFTNTQTEVLIKSWNNKAQNIAYIEGAGDKVSSVLSDLGLNVSILTANELANVSNLEQYDAIICGIRFANTRKDLEKYLPNLWQYIEDGGNVIMQYNTSMGLEIKDFSPLPITLSRSRVTDEIATVTFTETNSPILNTPNKISKKDFDNWVQERGVYFADKWDNSYKSVLSMHDDGEDPLKSSILYAPYGKGNFIYTSLVFFRQLPAGNIGAIKLFLNLINLKN